MKTKASILLVVLCIATLLAGCGGSPAPAPTTPAKPATAPSAPSASAKLIEPCDLISKAEAQQYIGQPMKDAEKKQTPAVGLKLCVYSTVSEGSGKFLQIGITQQAFMPNNGQTPKAIYDAIKGNFPNAMKIGGIGDDAFITPPGLHLLKGNYYLTVAVGNSNDPKNQELLKTIGKKIIEKI